MSNDPLWRAWQTLDAQSIRFLRARLAAAIAERDEARREVCSLEADTTDDQREYAVQRGWSDLFPKERIDHTCAQVPTIRSEEPSA